MRRVEEVIYIVPEKRQEFLGKCLNPPEELQQIMWLQGMRNQYFFQLNEFILMTFEYVGNDFRGDMEIISAYMDQKGYLVKKRRKDVPEAERAVTNWWAPIKVLGNLLTKSPLPDDEDEELSMKEQYHEMLSGGMNAASEKYDVSYDDDDWSESTHF